MPYSCTWNEIMVAIANLVTQVVDIKRSNDTVFR